MDYFDILLAKKLSGGGGGGEITVEGLNVGENGTYTAPSGKAYSPVVVNLPLGEKAITANGEYNASADDLKGYSKVTVNVAGFKVKDMPTGAISSFSDGTDNPLKELKVSIVPVQSGSGAPSPSNPRPISGWSGVRIGNAGVNVWDEEWEVGLIDATSGQNTPNNNYSRTKNYIPVRPNTTYYFTDLSKTLYFRKYDINKNYLGFEQMTALTNRNKSFDSDVAYIRFCWDGNTYNNTISVNLPNSVTEYMDYTGSIEPVLIPLGQTVYGGELDVTTGVLTINTLTKTIDGVNEQVGGVWGVTTYGYAVYVNMPVNKTTNTICDKFKYTNKGYVNMELYTYVGGSGTQQTWTFILPNTVTSKAEANDWFSNNPTTLTYPLASPITVQLTPTQVKSLLKDNNIWADCGDVISGKYFASL